MRPSRVAIVLWSTVIVVLLIVEIAEITHTFTVSIQSAVEDPLAFVFALVFTTILALIGAIFIGIYVSSRMLNPSGFTPFEEEMLKMHKEIRDLRLSVEQIEKAVTSGARDEPSSGTPKEREEL